MILLTLLSACRGPQYPSAEEARRYLELCGAEGSRLVSAKWQRICRYKPSEARPLYRDAFGLAREALTELFLYRSKKEGSRIEKGDYVTFRVEVREGRRLVLEDGPFSVLIGEGLFDPEIEAAFIGCEVGAEKLFDVASTGLYRNLSGQAAVKVEKLESLSPKKEGLELEEAYRSAVQGAFCDVNYDFYWEARDAFYAFAADLAELEITEEDLLAVSRFLSEEELRGMSLESYLSSRGHSAEAYSRQLTERADELLRRVLLLGGLASRLGIGFPEELWEWYREGYEADVHRPLDPDDVIWRYKCLEKAVLEFLTKPLLPDRVFAL